MKRVLMIAALAAAASAFGIGCEKDATTTTADNQSAEAKKNAEALKDAAASGANSGSPEARAAADKAAGRAADISAESAEAVMKQAEDLYRRAEANIKDRKFTDAEALLDQLDKLKDRMSPDWKAKVEQLRSTLDSAKKAATGSPG